MGQQVRSVSKSDLREEGGEKQESIHETSQLPVFAPLLHKCSGGANPLTHSFPSMLYVNPLKSSDFWA